MDTGKLMGEPRNRIGLTRPSTVLNQIIMTHTFGSGICDQIANSGELVIAGKNERFSGGRFARGDIGTFFHMKVDKPVDNIQPTVALPDLFPEITGLVSRLILVIVWIAFTAFITRIKRQEESLITRKPRRHIHVIGIDGKMHERAFFELDKGGSDGRNAVLDILLNSVTRTLTRKSVFEFNRSNGQTIERQEHINRMIAIHIITHLTHHREAILIIAFFRFDIQTGRRTKIRQTQMLPPGHAHHSAPHRATRAYRTQRQSA